MNHYVFVAAFLLSYGCIAQGKRSYDCPTHISNAKRPRGKSSIAVESGVAMPFTYKDASKTKGGLYKSDSRPGFYVAAFAYQPLTYWLEAYSGLQVIDLEYGLRSNFTQGGSEVYKHLYNLDIQVRIPIGFNFKLTANTQLSVAPAIVYSNFWEQGERIGNKSSGVSGLNVASGYTDFVKGDFGGSIRFGGDVRAVQSVYKNFRLNAQFSIDSKPLSPLTAITRLLHEDGSRKTYTQTFHPTMVYASLGISCRF